MPKILPIQNDFTTGILSPRLRARSDTAQYRSGVRDAVNFVTLRHGPMETRDGMLHVADINGTVGKLLPFQLTPESTIGEAFPVVVTDTDVAITGLTSQSAARNIVQNPDFNQGSASWEVLNDVGPSNVFFTGNSVRITAEFNADIGITQRVPLEIANAEHTLTVVSPFPNADIVPPTLVSVGTTRGGTDIINQSRSLTVTFDSGTNTEVWITVALLQGEYTVPFDERRFVDATRTREIDSVVLREPSVSGQLVRFDSPWNAEDLETLEAVMPPNGNTMYILSGRITPYKLEYDVSSNTWTLEEVTFTSKPGTWVDGSWPRTATFHQGRSWWGGVGSQPATFWASVSDDFENLTQGANANDALEFTLSRRGRIQWMESVRNLIIGTTNGEYIITAQGGVITPSDAEADQQSANGGLQSQAEPIGNLVLYVSLDGRKLRATTYERDRLAWVSRDLTFTAEHLTEESRIKEISFAKDPESTIWLTTTTGGLLGCSYEPFTEVIGWHRHLTDGDIQSTTVLERNFASQLYLLVSREVNGTNQLSLEILTPNIYMDNASLVANATPTDQIIGLTHLAGREVAVLCDGAVHPNIILDGNGSGVLQLEGTEIMVGLPFEATMTTLPPDYGAMRGSGMQHVKRWNRVTVRLYSSRDPAINGSVGPDRSTETPMDVPEAYRDYDYSIRPSGGWGDGSITITQALPVKTRISGLFGELNQENL